MIVNQPRKSERRFGLVLATLSALVISAGVQAESYLFKNATLHTATAKGSLKNADLLVRDGKIAQIGIDLAASDGVKVIDAKGKHVAPGFINASTNLGLVEIGAVSSTVDASTKKMGASFDISPAVNFRSTLIPQNRINGLTRAVVMPRFSESLFAGQGAIIALHSTEKGLLKPQAVQLARYGTSGASNAGGSRAAALAMLDKALTEAKYLRANQAKFTPGIKYEFSQPLSDLKALFPVLQRKVPLVITANRADDIVKVIALAKKHQFKLIVSGAKEGWMVAEQIAVAKVPVIMDPMSNLPGFDSLAVRLDGAARMYQAGVKLVFVGGGSHNAYLVRQSAGNAVAYGVPHPVAIEAMTINPAEVFGITNYGQLEIGMEADVVVWDGDPLEVTSNAEFVLIQGESQPMVSRATRLRDRYWELKGDQEQAFTK